MIKVLIVAVCCLTASTVNSTSLQNVALYNSNANLPDLHIKQTNISIGSNITLECILNPPETQDVNFDLNESLVYWYHGNQTVNSTTLVIQNASQEDCGIYVCVLTLDNAIMYKYIGLNKNTSNTEFYCNNGFELENGQCVDKCKCDQYGGECNKTTGKCECFPFATGKDCSQCPDRFHKSEGGQCLRCNCDLTLTLGCNNNTGDCLCTNPLLTGSTCQLCISGYYKDGNDECIPCSCNLDNSDGCSHTGRCWCKRGYMGETCEDCIPMYYKQNNKCVKCNCNILNTRGCDKNGACKCIDEYTGLQCNDCNDGYFLYEGLCRPCNCHPINSDGCDTSGKCICKEGYGGPGCERCTSHYYLNGTCAKCKCNEENSYGCDDDTGNCQCHFQYTGATCNECKSTHLTADRTSCIPCDCGKLGTESCPGGACNCKTGYTGERCDQCEAKYYSNIITSKCTKCECEDKFIHTGNCDRFGTCECKDSTRDGQQCDNCAHNHYKNSVGQCVNCDCDLTGTERCNQNGKCVCHSQYSGLQCNKCNQGYYLNNGICNRCNCDWNIYESCNEQTGKCMCKEGAKEPDCLDCIDGYYKSFGRCNKCPENKNVLSCTNVILRCKPGYFGSDCSLCAEKYYGNTEGICMLCNCDIYGASHCRGSSGSCTCNSLFTGSKCETCIERYEKRDNQCIAPSKPDLNTNIEQAR